MRKCSNCLTISAKRGSNIQCLFPTVRKCAILLSVSAIIGRVRFDTVPFTLPIVPDYLYDICAVHRAILLVIIGCFFFVFFFFCLFVFFLFFFVCLFFVLFFRVGGYWQITKKHTKKTKKTQQINN